MEVVLGLLPVFCVFGCSFVLCIMVFCCTILGVPAFCSALAPHFSSTHVSVLQGQVCVCLVFPVLLWQSVFRVSALSFALLPALSHVINRSHVAVFLFLSIFSAFPSFPSPVVHLSSCMSSQVFLCRRFLVSDFFVLFVSFFVFHTVAFSCPSLRLC